MTFKLKVPTYNKVITHFSGGLVNRTVSSRYSPKWVWFIQ
jgi:hypothetical protein